MGNDFLWRASSAGTIFRINQTTGVFTLVHQFTTTQDGQTPQTRLLHDNQGFMWGTTFESTSGWSLGTVFKVAIGSGAVTTVATFTGNGGTTPGTNCQGALIKDGSGMIWGTTRGGGVAGQGTIFKINPATGVLTTVIQFEDGFQMKGSVPFAGLVADGTGVLWGTTAAGGVGGAGTIFRINPTTGVLTTVVQFGNGVGKTPRGLLLDGADFLWGTTMSGGAADAGTLFKLNRLTGEVTTVVQFSGQGGSANGKLPHEDLCLDDAGRVWGGTRSGGVFGIGFGTLFRFDPATGKFTTMYEFSSSAGLASGEGPSGPARDQQGYFWGTTNSGNGTVWRLSETSLDSTTLAASGVGTTTATMNGTAVLAGGATTAWFEYLPVGVHMGRDKTTPQTLGSTPGVVPVAAPLTGLMLGRQYVYRCVVQNADGNIAYGMDQYFTTQALAPTAQTRAATNVSATGATLNCLVSANGAPTSVTFEYGLTTSYGSTSVYPYTAWGDSELNVVLAGLEPGRTYHFRVTATNSLGTAVGADLTFFTAGTPGGPPGAFTGGTTAVTSSSALLLGQAMPNGDTTHAYFEYGPTPAYGSMTTLQSVGNGLGLVAVSIATGPLLPGTTYYYRLIVTNSFGPALGIESSFVTLPPAPQATTGGSVSLGTTSVRVIGQVNGHNTLTEIFFDYGTDGVTFPISVSATPASITGDLPMDVGADLTNLRQSTTYQLQGAGRERGRHQRRQRGHL